MSTRLDIPITKPDRLVHALVGAAAALKWLISDPHGPSKRPTAAGRLTGRPSTAPAAPEANMIVLHYRAIPDLRRQVQQALAALAQPARQPSSAGRLCSATATRACAGSAAGPTTPRSAGRRTAGCARRAVPAQSRDDPACWWEEPDGC